MKINSNFEKILGIYKKQGVQSKKASKTSGIKGVSKGDKIELSHEARDLQVALQTVKQVPDIREDKVGEIKAKISTGAYNVSAKEVADKIAEGVFINEKA